MLYFLINDKLLMIIDIDDYCLIWNGFRPGSSHILREAPDSLRMLQELPSEIWMGEFRT